MCLFDSRKLLQFKHLLISVYVSVTNISDFFIRKIIFVVVR